MSHTKTSLLAKGLFAIALGVTVSAARAEVTSTADDATVQSVKEVLQHGICRVGVRAQTVDGVVYLYGHTSTYLERADIESAVRAAVPGHQVVSSIENSSYD
jgi:hypothetical protein